MATFFETQPGSFAFLPASADTALRVYVDGAPFDEAALSAMLSTVRIGLADNVQVTHSLDDVVYLYAFGRRISTLTLAGVSFLAGSCPATDAPGFSSLLDYYEQFRAGARAEPIQIQIGSGRSGLFEGFLAAINLETTQTDLLLGGFALNFQVLPVHGT